MWQGSLSPYLKKDVGIGKGRFIPLFQMTPYDWQVLDWPSLRNVAKNNLVEAAMKDRIVGFINVSLIEKGSLRGGYNVEVGASSFGSVNQMIDSPKLRNQLDVARPTVEAIAFEQTSYRLAGLFSAGGLVFLAPYLLKTIKGAIKAKPIVYETTEAPVADGLNQPIVVDSDAEEAEAEEYVQQIIDEDFETYDELDLALTWAFSVLASQSIEWLENWVDEAEQIVGDAEEKGLL